MNDVPVSSNLPRIVITMTPDGNLNIAGPIEDQILVYGMLEWAKLTLMQHHLRKAGDGAQLARPDPALVAAIKAAKK